ncbi:MAG: hypothetical protein Q9M31_07205, partial [Mariprofundus sp.]|nr:hypothetical protein [Mariprofundus sp.]
MFGDGTNYWKLRMGDDHIEMIIIANGFNISQKLKDEHKWILRIRESKPAAFTAWIGLHCPMNFGIVRKLPGNIVQTQFVFHVNDDENDFFNAEVPSINADAIAKEQSKGESLNGFEDLLKRGNLPDDDRDVPNWMKIK